MDQKHNIWELPDGEFLSFLYGEREREYTTYSSFGVNFWVIAAAIIGLLGYVYNKISCNYCQFDWHLVVYYSTVLGAILIFVSKLLNPWLYIDKWKNRERVTNVSANAPIAEMFWRMYVVVASVVFLNCINERNTVFWIWVSLGAVELVPWIDIIVNRDELIHVDKVGRIFPKTKFEVTYYIFEWASCFAIVFTSVHVWGEKEFGVKEFEMSCVLAIIVGMLWISTCHAHGKKHHSIDKWIEQYVYGNLSKKDAYFYILEYSHGYDIVADIREDFSKVKPYCEEIRQRRIEHEKYKSQLAAGKVKKEECVKYINQLTEDINVASKAYLVTNGISQKLLKMIELDAKSKSIESIVNLVNSVTSILNELSAYSDECIQSSKEFESYRNS